LEEETEYKDEFLGSIIVPEKGRTVLTGLGCSKIALKVLRLKKKKLYRKHSTTTKKEGEKGKEIDLFLAGVHCPTLYLKIRGGNNRMEIEKGGQDTPCDELVDTENLWPDSSERGKPPCSFGRVPTQRGEDQHQKRGGEDSPRNSTESDNGKSGVGWQRG